jgi:hypothetical protein
MRLRSAFIVLSLVLAAGPADAQCAEGAKPGSIQGLVIGENGQIRPWAPLRLTEPARKLTRIEVANKDGEYRFGPICPGEYTLDSGERTPSTSLRLQDGEALRTHVIVPSTRQEEATRLTALTLALFILGVLLFRHHNIVSTSRESLKARATNLAERILLESDQKIHKDESAKLVISANQIKSQFDKSQLSEWFFWSRGRELAGWMRVHEIERQVVAFLVPEHRVVERAVAAESDLRQLVDWPAAIALADRLRQTIQEVAASGSNDPGHAPGHAVDHLRQQLGEGLAILYTHTDTKFAELMEWHNKAMYLVYVALLAVMVLGLVFHHEELFLIGGVGGLMSRMARSLFRADVPNDYGASWTTLFLSPLLGAIAAWVGIAVIIWLREMNVLDDELFARIDWGRPTDAVITAMAFTLGFSERLFMSLLSKVEGKVQDETNKPSTRPVPPVTANVPAAGPVATGGGSAATPPTLTRSDRIIQDLDLTSGERVAFVGSAASATRAAAVKVVGAANVIDVTSSSIGSKPPFDGVLFETMPALADLPSLATALASALRPDGRVVFVGSSPLALFDRDAATQRAQGHAGPAVVKEALVATGLAAQDPPEKLGGTDPVEWIAAFFKPAPGGADR